MARQPLHLADFRALIAALPTRMHASTIQRERWQAFLARPDAAGEALRALFGDADEIQISRGDLRRFAQQVLLDRFVMATVLWGYVRPGDMRGNHAAEVCNHFAALLAVLQAARTQSVTDWQRHWQRDKIVGVGLSTHTKLFCFLPATVHGYPAIILDSVLTEVADRGVFAEMTGHFDERNYPDYLALIHQQAGELSVPAENLEYFLYLFGLDLKPESEGEAITITA